LFDLLLQHPRFRLQGALRIGGAAIANKPMRLRARHEYANWARRGGLIRVFAG